jgi:hypothetical protein
VPGWAAYKSTLDVVAGGIVGSKGRVTAQPGVGYLSIYSAPVAVQSTVAGARYVATGSVRSDRPGKRVCLELREDGGGTRYATVDQCVTTTTSWQAFPAATLTAVGAGHELDVNVSQQGTVADTDTFDVDGLELDDGAAVEVSRPAAPSGDPVLLAAGDLASCWSSGDEAVSRLLDTLGGTIAMLGDTEQNHGSDNEYAGCFDPTFGRHVWRTRPAVGDHEYTVPGAAGYFTYFGARAAEPGKGWYSYDLGAWHLVVLNSNCDQVGGCGPGSPEYEWLAADLAAHAKDCTAAYWHHPRFSAGGLHGSLPQTQPFWQLLYRYGAEFVLGGNDHNYQRFARQTPDGAPDPARGIRQFVVGTGGTQHYALGAPLPGTEVQDDSAFGVLRLTLHDGSFDWRFMPEAGKTFTDAGSEACSPPAPPDTTAPTVALTAPADGALLDGTVALTADASDAGGVDRVEFLADGRLVATDTSAPYAADWDTSAAAGTTVTLTARAIDAAGNAATSAARQVTVKPNLLTDGSFETGVGAWYAYHATATSITGAIDGARAARVTWNGAGASFVLMPGELPVGATTAGAVYTARAWVRSETPGRTVCLRIREWSGGSAFGDGTCLVATGSWQRTDVVRHVAVGGEGLEVYAYSDNPLAGDSFDLDGLTLTK